jgi:hypothetical protein
MESSASQIRVDDAQALEAWYGEAFLRLQQVACRVVAKIWIKKIQPKKVLGRANYPLSETDTPPAIDPSI